MSTAVRRPNQADIAAELGVSISTVSRALANEAGISESVRLDVQRVARALGYRSKHLAASVSLARRAVALVPLGSATSGISGFYVGIVEGMRAEAANSGMHLDVRLINESMITLDFIKQMLGQLQADSILLAGIDPWDDLTDWCKEAGIKVILVNGVDPLMRFSSVAPANFYGGYMATKRLIDAGHRRILHYTHGKLRPTILQRKRGFEAAIADNPDVEGIIVNSEDYSTSQLLHEIVAGTHGATALFSWNDIAAIEMIEGLHGEDLRLPPNFSIIGFDDLPLASMTSPRLSTIRVDREAMGRAAIRLLHESMDEETSVRHLQIGLSLVPGGTVYQVG
ncbi:LacI family transcriptional regulator [Devosia pacifica]|uniref:LacI family transcriptional regulator n=1 Tax=Devosia pacifica TaxID=1335967 RepID=A0A918VXC5_9HYPH|nr:LacI family DNA-binding transcriptional regulator [Devosia pacifica]GHA32280.1 LacI family transcriptional regulator [Devosia pacifica]